MQTITTTAQYNKEKRALFLDKELPYTSNQFYKIILKVIPLMQSVRGYKDRIKEILDRTYGAVPDLPEGVEYIRKVRDQADKRVQKLWS